MPDKEMRWLPNPAKGTQICVGFDGSDSDDWTAIRCQTRAGFNFTPRFGPDRQPTIWNPAKFGGRIPRDQVHVAVDHIFTTWKVARMYCDPEDWYSEIGLWSVKYGEKRVIEWATNREKAMFEAIKRAETDLRTKAMTHDGCPLTTLAVGNTKKLPRNNQRYALGKPIGEHHRKIDPGIAMILACEAAGDASSEEDGWDTTPKADISRVMYGFN